MEHGVKAPTRSTGIYETYCTRKRGEVVVQVEGPASSGRRVVVPFHSNATLHPKIVKQVLDAIEETSIQAMPPE
jgi:predicted RNA binding protein YcfA (HicA-like mRNA interferase family)